MDPVFLATANDLLNDVSLFAQLKIAAREAEYACLRNLLLIASRTSSRHYYNVSLSKL